MLGAFGVAVRVDRQHVLNELVAQAALEQRGAQRGGTDRLSFSRVPGAQRRHTISAS
jgi:hypothetical protein